MGLFDIFFKQKSRKTRTRRKRSNARPRTPRINSDIEAIKNQIDTINVILQTHDSDLGEQSTIIRAHSNKLTKLETIVASHSSQGFGQAKRETNPFKRPISTTELIPTPEPAAHVQPEKLDISRFSPQEKRILSIFFNNNEMALSYTDIAKSMGKSPNTIKNQMNHINAKAELFNYSVDNDSRKRFRLKQGLRIEKYLNIDRPVQRPDRLD